MFEVAELGHKVSKQQFDKQAPALREALLAAQYEVLELGKFSVVILINGVDGAGKGETVNLLNEWMDPRHIQTTAFGMPSEEERERPAIWRFWRTLPRKGKTGIFFGSWYTAPIVQRALGQTTDAELEHAMEEIVRFERMLANEGVLLLKFWLHLSKKQQRKRFRKLEKNKDTRWRVTPADWEHHDMYDQFNQVCERSLRETSTAPAPWILVEGADEQYRSLTVGNCLLDAMRRRIDEVRARESQKAKAAPVAAAARRPEPVDRLDVLRALDLEKTIADDEYKERLEELSGRLNRHSRRKKFLANQAAVLVFEGMDAAGKGGAIRRVTRALDARQYQVVPIAAPTDEERAQPYLWRFWRHIPRRGHVSIYDRSWYGRVLVERVEGFCGEADWSRAYGEINDFEEQLMRHGIIVAKFWLQISAEEQLRRFKERERITFKRFKITDEDWRNRKRWPEYERAVCDMVERTSTEIAPWTLIEANDKNYARLKVVRTLCDRLDSVLG